MSDLEIRKIYGHVNREEHTQSEHTESIETHDIVKQITTGPNTTISILTQEDGTNLELIKKYYE